MTDHLISQRNPMHNMNPTAINNSQLYVDFNSQMNPKYKLKKYLYFTDRPPEDFSLSFYNKITTWNSKTSLSKNYLTVKQPSIKPSTKDFAYSPFFKDNQVYQPPVEYKGSYSNQLDYKIFKIKETQEGNSTDSNSS